MTVLGKSLSIWQTVGPFTWWAWRTPGIRMNLYFARRSASYPSERLHVICLTLRHSVGSQVKIVLDRTLGG